MEGLQSTPALPWAVPEAVVGQQPAESQELTYLPIHNVGLRLGIQIEVQWEVEHEDKDDDSEEVKIKWWKATVCEQEVSPTAPTQSSHHVHGVPDSIYQLRYEAGEGFPDQTCNISFLSDHWLMDHSIGEEMAWRLAGDSWEPEEEVEEASEEEQDHLTHHLRENRLSPAFLSEIDGLDNGDGTITFKGMSEEQRKRNRQQFVQEATSFMSGFSAAQQASLGEGIATILNEIPRILERICPSEAGRDLIDEDVQKAFSELHDIMGLKRRK
ncbi:hypothetical protein CEUSTIGMA_g10208.t1 [Chlamydomonas eustigma]|uniref:Uncharacterized protein n=1 Tax=Chlamydomonas eustigma TaxID=1157962 RepID=A0A250XIQ3_9CHLO|nr:hypothetical protein CEUSTIGMA_g10208.t1 [Chlamydomonas eustigma]|eukprot:GAX82782.1 hypothetical protein CEUSTIGMA_g10208.t1 [Chlamydomonas eustigma]